jgi:uncharacterized membrane protein
MSGEERPRVQPAITGLTRAARVASLVITGAGVAATLIAWPSLPEVVPVHWNAGGAVDAEGPRSMVLVLAAVWLALVTALGWLSRHPRAFNYPVEVTPRNAARVYGEGVALMAWTMLCMTAVFAGLVLMSFDAEAGALVGFALVGAFAVMITGIVRVVRASHSPEDASTTSS